jgi:hypothetical protein
VDWAGSPNPGKAPTDSGGQRSRGFGGPGADRRPFGWILVARNRASGVGGWGQGGGER